MQLWLLLIEAGDSLHEYIRFILNFLCKVYVYNILLRPNDIFYLLEDVIKELETEQAEVKEQNENEDANTSEDEDEDEDEEAGSVNNVSNSVNRNDIILHKNFNHLYYAFYYFDNELCKFISEPMKIKLLTQFGTPHDAVNVEQPHSIYQWFFERELLIGQSSDRPGYLQTVCDLFCNCNYVLSFFITMNLSGRRRIYTLWFDTEVSFLSILEYNSYVIDIIETSHNAPYIPYYFYWNIVKSIASSLIQYQKLDHQLYIEQLLINLNKKQRHDCYLSLIIVKHKTRMMVNWQNQCIID